MTTVTINEDYLRNLHYCLDNQFPAPLTAALLTLADDTDDDTLIAAWKAWRLSRDTRPEWRLERTGFIDVVRDVTDEEATFCEDCRAPAWMDDASTVAGDYSVCTDCVDYYITCYECDELHRDTSYHNGRDYCGDCFSASFTYCDYCDDYFHDDDEHNCRGGCDCEAPHTRFEFPADGHGVVAQNERLTLELPKGTIDEVGISRITQMLYSELIYGEAKLDWRKVDATIESVGHTWQTKRGNFTRRLSSALYSQHKVKLALETISEIGNIARAHSSDASTWHVEFTRDLNGSPEEFANEESCWWGSHSASRCCLKNWGGLGMRNYETDDTPRDDPSGRVWVQPLNEELRPTHDTLDAHAYLVFNAYGDLSGPNGGYVAARIVAHLTGRTYRKIEYSADYQYVNNSSGFLVADEETCKRTDSLYFGHDPHDERDARTLNIDKEAA